MADCKRCCYTNNTIRMFGVWLIFMLGVWAKLWTGEWWLIPWIAMFWVKATCNGPQEEEE